MRIFLDSQSQHSIIAALLTFGVGIYPYLQKRTSLTRLFALSNVSLAIWNITDAIAIQASTHRVGVIIDRIFYISGVFLVWFFFRFIMSFANIPMNRFSGVWKWMRIIGIFFILTLPTSFIIRDINTLPNATAHEIPGIGFPLFVVFMVYTLGYALYHLICQYSRSSVNQQNQIRYMGIALFFPFVEAILYFIGVYASGFPFFYYYLQVIYVAIVAYAILAHRLLDISVVIRKTLLYSLVSAGIASVYAGGATLLARLLENPSAVALSGPSDMLKSFSSYLQTLYGYSCITTALFSVGLGIFVLLKGPGKAVNILWCITCTSIAAWSASCVLMSRSVLFSSALVWSRVLIAASIMIPIIFSHFAASILKIKMPRTILVGYMLACYLQLMNALGYLVSVESNSILNYRIVPFRAYTLFAIYFFFFGVYAHGLLFFGMNRASKVLKNQIKFIFLGTGVGFLGAATTFFMDFGINIFPYGVYVIPVYILTVTYSILKHNLMDINVVIRKTFIYSLVSAALVSVYVGIIMLLARLLEGRQGPASIFSSALAAIFITFLFNPLRIRTQRWIDHYFPRESLDPQLLQETAGGFAHEMKRPLSKISLPAELALLDLERVRNGEKTLEEVFPKVQERLKFIMRQSIDAGYMIEAIRELSSPSPTPVSLVNLKLPLKNALAAEKELLEKHGVFVSVNLPADLPSVTGRVKQLEIVFVNLIKNAAEAMADMPRNHPRQLSVRAWQESVHVFIEIKDSGPGIKSSDLPMLFRSRYSTKGANGSGMGLFLSRQLIEVHLGTLSVVRKEGEGAEFVIQLPKK